MNGDKVLSKRDRGHKARFLQIVKAGQSAVIFLCKARRSEYVIIQFPLRVCHVYHKERQQEHSFILSPEQTGEKQPEPKHSLKERLQYEQEQKKQKQVQKAPKQKKQDMEL